MDIYEMNENKNVVYTYRKHIFLLNKLIPVFGVIALLMTVFAIIFVSEPIFIAFFIFVAAEMGFMYFFYKKFISMKLSLDEDGIHFENYQKKFIMAYRDITRISSRKLTNFGGWITFIAQYGEKFTLTVAMKDISEFIRNLHEFLLVNEREDLANNELLLKAYQVASFIDGDFRRVGYFGVRTIFYFIFAVLLGGILPSFGFYYAALAFFFTVLIGLVTLIYLEYGYFRKKLIKQMKETKFEIVTIDEESEKKIIHRFMIILMIVHLVFTTISIFI